LFHYRAIVYLSFLLACSLACSLARHLHSTLVNHNRPPFRATLSKQAPAPPPRPTCSSSGSSSIELRTLEPNHSFVTFGAQFSFTHLIKNNLKMVKGDGNDSNTCHWPSLSLTTKCVLNERKLLVNPKVCRSITFGNRREKDETKEFLRLEFEHMRSKDRSRWNFDFYGEKPCLASEEDDDEDDEDEDDDGIDGEHSEVDSIGHDSLEDQENVLGRVLNSDRSNQTGNLRNTTKRSKYQWNKCDKSLLHRS
jgi:hypothetical protein